MGGGDSKESDLVYGRSGPAFAAAPCNNEKILGLDNSGNTCYCNSVIQMLYFCVPLRRRCSFLWTNHFPSIEASQVNAARDTILYRLCELFHQLEFNPKKARRSLKPDQFMNKVKSSNVIFNNLQQQDAHELAMFVIGSIIEDERKLLDITSPDQPKSPIQRLFEGEMLAQTFCMECDTVACRTERLVDLALDIDRDTSLVHCTKLFSSVEFMTGDDKFRCDACTASCDARRRMVVKVPPPVLLVHLKRFKYNERSGNFTKIVDRVPFSTTFVVNTVDGVNVKYALSSIVIHSGSTPQLGHYVAIGRSPSQVWYVCNDDQTSEVPLRDMSRFFGLSELIHDPQSAGTPATAYLLLYTALSELPLAHDFKVDE